MAPSGDPWEPETEGHERRPAVPSTDPMVWLKHVGDWLRKLVKTAWDWLRGVKPDRQPGGQQDTGPQDGPGSGPVLEECPEVGWSPRPPGPTAPYRNDLEAWLTSLPELDARISRPELEPGPSGDRVRLCIDLGTTASAVAYAGDFSPILAILELPPREGGPAAGADGPVRTGSNRPEAAQAIASDIAYHPDRKTAILGSTARTLEERNDRTFEYYRSLKRLLSDMPRGENAQALLQPRVTAMLEELLLLALMPSDANTVQALLRQEAKKGWDEEWRPPPEELAARCREMGLAPSPASRLAQGSLELYLSIPNAFGNFESNLIHDAAMEAGRRIVRQCRNGQAGDEPPPVTVRLLREAEAVAWWMVSHTYDPRPSSPKLNERWLIFDVGGGSTDTAVVTVRTFPHDNPEIALLFHCGVAFGGNDVDELFLFELASQAGFSRDQLEAQIDAESSRASVLRNIARQKQIWSTKIEAQPEVSGWLERLMSEEGVATLADAGGSKPAMPDFTGPAYAWLKPTLAGDHFLRRYAYYLLTTVRGSLTALFTDHEGVTVDRVILSGRGSLLPYLKSFLARCLLRMGRISSEEQVIRVPTVDASDLKLACVRGVAVAAQRASLQQELSQDLSDTVSYRIGDIVAIWPRGHRLYEHLAHARLALDTSERPLPRQRIHFTQYRCPPEVVYLLPPPYDWAQRHLGDTQVDLPAVVTVEFDCRTSEIRAWKLNSNRGPSTIRLMRNPEVPEWNPISGLKFGWADRVPGSGTS